LIDNDEAARGIHRERQEHLAALVIAAKRDETTVAIDPGRTP
jgi:hypothetical protein